MASNIDPTQPVPVNPTTLSVRTNFQYAHDEIEALQSGMVPIAGNVEMTGPLLLNADPTEALGATTKQYADTKASAASPAFTGNPTTQTTPPYGDSSQSLAPTAFVQQAVAPSFDNTGRNILHNSQILICQRGFGTWSGAYNYTADRWSIYMAHDTLTTTIVGITDTERTAIGDEAAFNAINCVVAGSASAGSISVLTQRIENLRRFAGKRLIASFYGWSASGTPRIGMSFDQIFGSGGSPSPSVVGALQTVQIGNSPARYYASFTIPSVIGKTFGTTAGTDQMVFNLVMSASSDQYGGIMPTQSNTFKFWGLQVEIAQPGQTLPTPLEKLDAQIDLAKCQRFYQVSQANFVGFSTGSGTAYANAYLPVTMRAAPTVTIGTTGNTNWTLSGTYPTNGNAGVTFAGTVPGAANYGINANFTVSADF